MRLLGTVLMLVGLVGHANGAKAKEIRFQGGHPWLSRSQVVDLDDISDNRGQDDVQDNENDEKLSTVLDNRRAIDHPINGTGRRFDITVALYASTLHPRTEEERKRIEECFKWFAKGVYEATEGRHFIGTVYIDEIVTGCTDADIRWKEKPDHDDPDKLGDRAYTTIGMGGGQKIVIYDHPTKSEQDFGFTLAHEWGHYMYGFGDEYAEKKATFQSIGSPHYDDIPVLGSLMSCDNGSFGIRCNLSYVFDSTKPESEQGLWRDTHKTAQYRMFGKSCLEQLCSPADPSFYDEWNIRRHGFLWFEDEWEVTRFYLSFRIPDWPEFAGINPLNPPNIDLAEADGETKALRYFNVKWNQHQVNFVMCLDRSGSINEVQLENEKANAKNLIDMAPEGAMIEILAFDASVSTIVPFTEVTATTRASMKAKVDSVASGGNTALWDAANQALADIKTIDPDGNNVSSILLLTDGQDNSSSATRADVVKTCQEMGVAFNSISYGSAADEELGAASAATGGKNAMANDSLSSLSGAFSRLGTYGTGRSTLVDSEGITEAMGTWTERFTVDSTATNLHVTVTLSVPTSQGIVRMITPSGLKCAANTSLDVGNESSWTFLRSAPEVGSWQVVAEVPSGTKVTCHVSVSAMSEPPRLTLWTDENDTTVFAALSQGWPVDGAYVRALVDDNGMMKEVAFIGIGAGIYWLALSDCGAFTDGFTVRADAEKGVATHINFGIVGVDSDLEGQPITESFTRSEWLDLRRLNEIPLRYVEVHPRWPWEGKVDVDFHVVTTDNNTKVSAKLTGIDNRTGDAYEITTVTCDDTLSDLSMGEHRATWDAGSDLPGMDIEDFAIRFDVTTGTALGVVTGLTASAGTYFDGVHVSWGAVTGATGYRVYRSETADGTGRVLLATQTGRTYTDSTAIVGKQYYYYWIQPIATGTNGVVKHEGQLTVSGGAWRCQLGGVSGLSASSGSHYDGVHLSWTGPNGATSYRIYRGTTANASAKTQIATSTSTYYIDTTAAKLQKYYYYWVEPIAVVSGTTYVGTMNSSGVSGWRNKLGTPTIRVTNWHTDREGDPEIDLYIDSRPSGATRIEYMSGDKQSRWNAMEAVGDGSSGYEIFTVTQTPQKIAWAWAYRTQLRIYVRAACNEGVSDWVKWNLDDHRSELTNPFRY